MLPFNYAAVDVSWSEIIHKALTQVEHDYLTQLTKQQDWLPGANQIFNAFSLPMSKVNYVLFGESPYPRKESANGYAFWDAAVVKLWAETGLAKQVNKATSLRNMIKMLLVAQGTLDTNNLSQQAIAAIDKTPLIQSCDELFANMQKHGILLLNASLVLSSTNVSTEARQWLPFITLILQNLAEQRPNTQLILLGNVAKTINKLNISQAFSKTIAEHPYNLSFIHNPTILHLFKPMQLLHKNCLQL